MAAAAERPQRKAGANGAAPAGLSLQRQLVALRRQAAGERPARAAKAANGTPQPKGARAAALKPAEPAALAPAPVLTPAAGTGAVEAPGRQPARLTAGPGLAARRLMGARLVVGREAGRAAPRQRLRSAADVAAEQQQRQAAEEEEAASVPRPRRGQNGKLKPAAGQNGASRRVLAAPPVRRKARRGAAPRGGADVRGRQMVGALLGHLASAKRALVEEGAEGAKAPTRGKAAAAEKRAKRRRERRREEEADGAMQEKEIQQLQERLEGHYANMKNFIRTKVEPTIFYLPAKHTPVTERSLEETREALEQKISSLKTHLRCPMEELLEDQGEAEEEEEEASEEEEDDDDESWEEEAPRDQEEEQERALRVRERLKGQMQLKRQAALQQVQRQREPLEEEDKREEKEDRPPPQPAASSPPVPASSSSSAPRPSRPVLPDSDEDDSEEDEDGTTFDKLLSSMRVQMRKPVHDAQQRKQPEEGERQEDRDLRDEAAKERREAADITLKHFKARYIVEKQVEAAADGAKKRRSKSSSSGKSKRKDAVPSGRYASAKGKSFDDARCSMDFVSRSMDMSWAKQQPCTRFLNGKEFVMKPQKNNKAAQMISAARLEAAENNPNASEESQRLPKQERTKQYSMGLRSG